MYALVDCNNFYASCERVFQPRLMGRPVVVLSNNDGCVIARSQEAKDLDIPMGAHYHTWEAAFRRNNVIVCSSNYPLYGDMSARVMTVLKEFSPHVEVYSIDESFLSLHHVPVADLLRYGQRMRQTVAKHVGMPVGAGIAATKTLAKVASKLSKQHNGVCVLHPQAKAEEVLATFPVSKVWGIGGRYARFLQGHEISTALDLCHAKDSWIQQHLSIVGLRTVMELRGTPCLSLEEVAPRKQVIAVSRTFRNAVKDYTALSEALATYTARAAEKLRAQQCGCTIIKVHVATNIYQDGLSQYGNSATVSFALPTDYTPRLVKAAVQGLKTIYRPGYAYKIAGVYFMGLVAEEEGSQLDLFNTPTPAPSRALMKCMDRINGEHGRGTLKLAAEGGTQPWRMRQKHLSQRYTTRWNEVLKVGV